MQMQIRSIAAALLIVFFVSPFVGRSAPPQAALPGFTSDGAAAERDAERAFRAIPKPENLRESMRVITQEPHHAGSPSSRKVAEYVLSQFKAAGLDASIESFEALMPYPRERQVELVAPEKYVATLKEPRLEQDRDSDDEGQLPTFNAYSADGDVTADLVYVNYGTPADYEQLEKLGVAVKGKIVIERYGNRGAGTSRRRRGSTARSAVSFIQIRTRTATSRGTPTPAARTGRNRACSAAA